MSISGPSLFVLHEREAVLQPHGEASHTEHGLLFLVDGWFEMEHGGPLRVEPGVMTIVPAGVPHRSGRGRDAEYWLVGFCAACVGLDESQLLMSPFRRVRHGALPAVTIPKGRRRRLLRVLGELKEEAERGTAESLELARALLLLVLGEVRRAMTGREAEHAAQGSLVADALEVIQQRCLQPISLRDVAAAVHRTPTHVAAAVKQSTGYSVGDWIRAGRVAEAAARLVHTDASLDEIASAIGWSDKTHFTWQFRKVYGTTPAAWRREQRGAHRQAPRDADPAAR